ncbi:MAG: transposase [Gammaproteobacteria bacterium]
MSMRPISIFSALVLAEARKANSSPSPPLAPIEALSRWRLACPKRSGVLGGKPSAKTPGLFIALLERLWQRYRGKREILLILDNYCAHKSQATHAWLAAHQKFRLLFQPTYHPWVNRIKRLWKTLHDTITRNHRYPTISQLMNGVHRFLHVVQPFPGNQHALAQVS